MVEESINGNEFDMFSKGLLEKESREEKRKVIELFDIQNALGARIRALPYLSQTVFRQNDKKIPLPSTVGVVMLFTKYPFNPLTN